MLYWGTDIRGPYKGCGRKQVKQKLDLVVWSSVCCKVELRYSQQQTFVYLQYIMLVGWLE